MITPSGKIYSPISRQPQQQDNPWHVTTVRSRNIHAKLNFHFWDEKDGKGRGKGRDGMDRCSTSSPSQSISCWFERECCLFLSLVFLTLSFPPTPSPSLSLNFPRPSRTLLPKRDERQNGEFRCRISVFLGTSQTSDAGANPPPRTWRLIHVVRASASFSGKPIFFVHVLFLGEGKGKGKEGRGGGYSRTRSRERSRSR